MPTKYIYLTFIILIIIIGIVYIPKEGFDDSKSSQSTVSNTNPQITNSILLSTVIKNQLSSITDSNTLNILQEQLVNLQTLLNRYSTLDIPIIMTDEGKICSMWGNYAGGKYRQQENQCIDLDNTNILKCLDSTGIPNTCGNIMTNGYITSKSTINYQPMLENTTLQIINTLPNIYSQVENMQQTADTIITSLSDRNSIQLQQQELIKNNNENMIYKNKIMNDNSEKLSKKQNETNIHQNDFSNFINQITQTDSTTNTYYKIILGLIIAIIIMGILNILFSNILS